MIKKWVDSQTNDGKKNSESDDVELGVLDRLKRHRDSLSIASRDSFRRSRKRLNDLSVEV